MSGLPPNNDKNKKSGGEKRKSTAPDDVAGKKRKTRADARKERDGSSLTPLPLSPEEMKAEVARLVEEGVKARMAEEKKKEAAEKRKKEAAEKKARAEKESERIRDLEKGRKRKQAEDQQAEIARQVDLALARDGKKKEVEGKEEKKEKKEEEKDERGRSSSKMESGEPLEGVSQYKMDLAKSIRQWKENHGESVVELLGDDRCEPCQKGHRTTSGKHGPPSEALKALNKEFNRCVIGSSGRCSGCQWNGGVKEKCKYRRPPPAPPADVKPDLPLAGPYSRFGSGHGFGANFDAPPAPPGGYLAAPLLPTTPHRRPGLTGLGLPLSPASPSTTASTSRIANIGDRLTGFNEELQRAMENAQWALHEQNIAHYFPSVHDLVRWFVDAANRITESGQDLGRLTNPRPDFSRR
ncbi:hypothetical protein FFLO_07162 [Filobasidium floriforme]|uniref:Uncharacterized protein n=1 Tax=Filobasidium floriforme TaxID=5210 RepID=A0A8K0JDF6_9TREE|nr:uncharacterized protein HD553DRAFT_324020 [Filobasidium floriforme]XP_046038233.1 uncharacterized protein HD553DRAFT_322961 [Filobasidium floriforme]KAG7527209.1 hypothetical protein FFLO_07162 [Filobasidium floriforme]KAH8084667.1 hypothetical protein HD553DRAFT_324020 [Filobasidium floriforme]KAH8087487.1 hypothetical protein HD553DRAFT_322961 [Filobasidium floriforme]